MTNIFKSEWLKQKSSSDKKITNPYSFASNFYSFHTSRTSQFRKFFNLLVGGRIPFHSPWVIVFS